VVAVRAVRWLCLALLVLLALGLIAASIHLLDYSSSRPLWERLPYWAMSALLAIVAACLVFIIVMYAAYFILERWEEEWDKALRLTRVERAD
jgi:flagellar biosynthesis protein FlhB